MSKRTSYSKIYRPDVRFVRVYPTDAFLPADGFLPSAPTVKKCIRADGLLLPGGHKRVRADVPMRPRRHKDVRPNATMRLCGHRRIRFTSLALALPPTPSLALHGQAHVSMRMRSGRSKKIKK
jgi:hypothetical protein